MRQVINKALVLSTVGLALVSCSTLSHRPSQTPLESGVASWYGKKFQGHKTASGETYDTKQLTAAHRTLPFGTLVQVHSLTTGKSVTVRVNDRGPFVEGRIIDVSYQAAVELGMIQKGEDRVELFLAR